jgi:hypothetical protein
MYLIGSFSGCQCLPWQIFFYISSHQFFANQPVPCIIVIAASKRKCKYENGLLVEILVDKDVRQYLVCWSLLTFSFCSQCLFATWETSVTIPSPPSGDLAKPNNQPEWCCETSIKTIEIARVTRKTTMMIQVMCTNWINIVLYAHVLVLPSCHQRKNKVYEGFYIRIFEWWISELMKSPRFLAIFDL